MQIDSIKFKGFSCFTESWAGLDEFKPITVIIGRNNSGKSHLLDLVELMTKRPADWKPYSHHAHCVLSEQTLKQAFPDNPGMSGFNGGDWLSHGSRLIDVPMALERKPDKTMQILLPVEKQHRSPKVQGAREKALKKIAYNAVTPLHEKRFCRLLADRNIGPESPAASLTIQPDGTGATNLIRRQLNSSRLDENLIRERLVDALRRIFRPDMDIKRIEVKQHDETEGDDALWEIYLGENGKELIPLSRSGSGLKTVLLALLNLLAVPEIEEKSASDFVFAFEELENNLHPAVLRRLFDYLTEYVENKQCHLFITTHSSVALDYFGPLPQAQIIRVWHDGDSAHAETLETHFDKVGLLTELGVRPSDLLQANGIVWLEGPSDRIYFNRFMELFSGGRLVEGRDYQCAFYGGALLARSAFKSADESSDEFANLLRLNSNIVVICDSDKTASKGTGSRIKDRVRRIKQELENIPAAKLWITDAKEIENYIPGDVWGTVYEKKNVNSPDKYDRFPTSKIADKDYLLREIGRRSFDKCEFATKAAPFLEKEHLENRFDFSPNIQMIIEQIESWNS